MSETERTTHETLNRTGWECPRCGAELLRSGGPNAPETVTCRSAECAWSATIEEEDPGILDACDSPDDRDECAMMRERLVAGTNAPIPTCPIHPPRGGAAALATALRDLLTALGPVQVLKAFPGDASAVDAFLAAVGRAQTALRGRASRRARP